MKRSLKPYIGNETIAKTVYRKWNDRLNRISEIKRSLKLCIGNETIA